MAPYVSEKKLLMDLLDQQKLTNEMLLEHLRLSNHASASSSSLMDDFHSRVYPD